MRDFVLMTDSCCDMAPQMAEELGLIVLPLSLELGGATYHNYLDGREIGFSDFYSRIRSGETATTSAISVGTIEEAMRPVLESGRDIPAKAGRKISGGTAGLRRKDQGTHLPLVYGG